MNEGFPGLTADCKILIDFALTSATVLKIGRPYRGLGGGGEGDFFQTFLEWSVDHIIYRDSIMNRSSFIYCSLACSYKRP